MCLNDIRKLDTIAKENIVDLEFYGDKVTIYTNRRKVTKVPNFVIGDPEKLCAWIDSKIKTAWP